MRYFIVTYMHKANGQIDEIVTVSKRLKNKDIVSASVILDYQEKSVFKCRIDNRRIETQWQQLDDYYREHYLDVITQLSNLSQ